MTKLDEMYEKLAEMAEIADQQGIELAKSDQKTDYLDQRLDQTLSDLESRILEIRKIAKD